MLSTLFYTLQTLRPNNRSYVPDLLRDRTAVFLHRNDESPDRNGFLRVFSHWADPAPEWQKAVPWCTDAKLLNRCCYCIHRHIIMSWVVLIRFQFSNLPHDNFNAAVHLLPRSFHFPGSCVCSSSALLIPDKTKSHTMFRYDFSCYWYLILGAWQVFLLPHEKKNEYSSHILYNQNFFWLHHTLYHRSNWRSKEKKRIQNKPNGFLFIHRVPKIMQNHSI